MLKNPRSLKSSHFPRFYMPIAVLFVVLLIITNIVVQKVIPVLGYFILTVGDFIFPLVYIMDGLLTEVYGYAASRRVIWLALFCNILMALIVMFAISLPAARDWPYQDQFVLILGRAPQIVGASVIAFLVGEFVNSYILARLKVVMHGKKLWFRSFTAMATGQGIDTILFNTIAFFGILSWHRIFVLSVSVYCFKLLYEVIFIPVIYLLADILKHKEGIDIYDKNTNFNPFKLKWV